MAASSELTDRAQQVLKVLVERYIQDGQPVGSRLLAKASSLNLSPATIRNIMSDLEELGLVTSPHPSAGRVPTVRGYRFFIDALLTIKPLDSPAIARLKDDLIGQDDARSMVGVASKLLSSVTQMAGVVMLPRRQSVAFRHIEFLPLSNARVLVILVTNEHEVHNKIIHPAKPFSAAELLQAANYLNDIFEGKDLVSVRRTILNDLQETREAMNREMFHAIEMANLAFSKSEKEEDFVLSGETNLMDFADLADMDRLRQLFDAFNHKRGLIHLLDQCLEAEGVQIFIGEESGYQALDSCSVVTSPYAIGDRAAGVLGVIGPTRMAYQRVIPLVDVTAKLLGAALNQQCSSTS